MSRNAWVTLATNDSYSLGALVVAHSLKRVHTVHQLAVLITPGVSEAMKTKLRNVFNVVEEVNLLDSKDEANLALLKRPELGVTFTKLHCWRLTQFDKCVFLDADTLVLRNSDELFEREELSAAPDIGWPDCFNSGVYVFRPNVDTFSSLLKFAITNGSFDGGDQGLLNAYFSDWAHKDIQKHLPFIYNTSSVATYSYLPAFKHFGQNTKILHFIGVAKPWLQNFNSETRKVYVPSECQHLANFLQYWWDIFADDVHSRLSPDMQQAFSHWIAPRQQKQVSGAQYRSAVSGTIYGGEDAGNSGHMQQPHEYHHHHQQQQQEQREQFVPSYEPTTVYVDPWEVYLQRQERERELRKQEEERLYFQYLNELRAQEQHSRQEYEQWLANQAQQGHDHGHDHNHHDHRHAHQPGGGDGSHHHHHHHEPQHSQHHHHDANIFQRTEQWVDKMVQQHQENRGHWEQAPTEHHAPSQHQHQQQQQHQWQQQEMPPQHTQHQQHAIGEGDQNAGHAIQQQQQHHPSNEGRSSNVDFHPQSWETDGGPKKADVPASQHQETATAYHEGDTGMAESAPTSGENVGTGGDASGLAGALAQLHMGEAKSKEQEAYEEHMRRQCWETGNIDYMGRDSFDNIWKRIQQTLSAGTATETPVTPAAKTDPTPPTTPRASRSRSSRSRSTTPKRDPRDRSPTPQPEDKVPLEKKEAHVVLPPAIVEEEDDGGSGSTGYLSSVAHSGLARRRQTRMPPPIQYDPTTNTTTLTKKVFAGYQQFITTKSPEGKTRSHTKLVYDPSIDAEEEEEEKEQPAPKPEPAPEVIQAPARTRKTEDVVDSVPVRASRKGSASVATSPKPETQTSSATTNEPRSPTVPKPSPSATAAAAQQQQLVQEPLAGKPSVSMEPTTQPIKTVRKKRHISPPSKPLPQATATSASINTITAKSADSAQSSTSSASASNRTPPPASLRKPSQPAKAVLSSSGGDSHDLTVTAKPPSTESTRTTSGGSQNQPQLPKTTTRKRNPQSLSSSPLPPSSVPSTPKPDSSSSSALQGVGLTRPKDEPVIAVSAEVDDVKPTPPVPPRRKRETKMARLGKI